MSNLLSEWARLFIVSLRQAGVERIIISPGSRSTPFAWAALEDCELQCQSVVDERSAAFVALGQARASGRPSAILCTSGSAAANYFPAVVEAAMAPVPLVVLTADRPFELQGARAPQTIDQVKLYGHYPRAYFELGMPDSQPSALWALQRIAAQAVALSLGPLPGPVHVNLRARKPLEPAAPDSDAERVLSERVSGLIKRGPSRAVSARRARDPATLEYLAERLAATTEGVIVCGPVEPACAEGARAVFELAQATAYPLLCEAGSQLRYDLPAGFPRNLCIDAFDHFVGEDWFQRRAAPRLALQLGQPPVSAGWAKFSKRQDLERYVVCEGPWSDPDGSARAVIDDAPYDFARALCEALARANLATSPGRRQWRAQLSACNDAAWQAVERELEATSCTTEPAAVRAVAAGLRPGSQLVLGNSLPVREPDWFTPATSSGLRVYSQRGANGIDGVLSGAVGIAGVSERPTTLLVGDLSFLHDLNGLWAARDLAQSLSVVILDNGGGQMFEQLPIARLCHDPGRLAYWTTPHGVDLSRVGDLFGLPVRRALTTTDITEAVYQAQSHMGCQLLVVPVAGKTVDLLRRIRAGLEESLCLPSSKG